jgi:hypothetical protein
MTEPSVSVQGTFITLDRGLLALTIYQTAQDGILHLVDLHNNDRLSLC